MRLAIFGAISTLLTIYTIINAYIQRGQFFSTCIYISHSNASILVLFNMAIYLAIVIGKTIQKIFFGQLRAIEVEHLYERSWFAVTELCLAMTIFRGEFNAKFAIFLTILLMIKIFHWLMQDRIDFMEQGINQSLLFHIRLVSVIGILTFIDVIMLTWTLDYTLKFGISMIIVLGFEYTILLSNALTGAIKYIFHTIDNRRETPWENKSMYIFYIDLVRDFFVLITYIMFFGIIVHRYGLPLHLIRDLYVTFRSFVQHCRDLIHYIKATKNMNERYPNATAEDLQENDNICIICREEMTVQDDANSSDVPKKLRCGHIFHLRCLKSWLERQQSCPTCRCSLLETTPVANRQAPAEQAPAQQAPAPAQQAAPAQAVPQPNPSNVQIGQTQPYQRNTIPTTETTNNRTGVATTRVQLNNVWNTTTPSTLVPNSSSQISYMNISPNDSAIPVILTPVANVGPIQPGDISNIPSLESLSDEKLLEIEGSLRENVISRIKTISEINHQLAGIVTQLNQVLNVMTPPNVATVSTIQKSSQTSVPATTTISTSTTSTLTSVSTTQTSPISTTTTATTTQATSLDVSAVTTIQTTKPSTDITVAEDVPNVVASSTSSSEDKGKSPMTFTSVFSENTIKATTTVPTPSITENENSEEKKE